MSSSNHSTFSTQSLQSLDEQTRAKILSAFLIPEQMEQRQHEHAESAHDEPVQEQAVQAREDTEQPAFEPTFFGMAADFMLEDLLNRVAIAVQSWNPDHDYMRVRLPDYQTSVRVNIRGERTSTYFYHSLLYGPQVRGAAFQVRTDNESFWSKQWGRSYSPFRVAQEALKAQGLFLVDHTFNGNTPFVYLYKVLPPREVIANVPWHGYSTIPGLKSIDYSSKKKLSKPEIQFGAAMAWLRAGGNSITERIGGCDADFGDVRTYHPLKPLEPR